MLRHRTIMKAKTTFLILLSVGLVLATVGVFFRPVHAQTWVEGHITHDTTWTLANSPYRAINDVIVDSGVLLTIEPGVEVQFADGFSLIVEGSLIAVGNENDPIVFTSTRSEPSPGAWATIQYAGKHFVFGYTRVEYATYGITISSSNAEIRWSELLNCREAGIHVNTRLMTIGNITITNNAISSNKGNGIYTSTGYDATIYNLTISKNSILTNNGNGVLLSTGTSFGSYYVIRDVTISDNTISGNVDSGVRVSARSEYGSSADIHNVTISGNRIFSNYDGVVLEGLGSSGLLHDIRVSNNIIASNIEKGIFLYRNLGGAIPQIDIEASNNSIATNKIGICVDGDKSLTNFTGNMISYNKWYGIQYLEHGGHSANYNDIYDNYVGMYITSTRVPVNVNAEDNYWGHSTGPYHASLNPEGEGNPVNGDGTDLDFIPFLTSPIGTINERPVATIEVDKTYPNVDETVTFDASGSTDEGRIDYYFFDFGDGTNSNWTPLSVVTHKYASEGTYNATLIVMDDFGVTSPNVYVKITVGVGPKEPQIEVSISSDRDVLRYERNEARITVNVRNTGSYVARDVSVSLGVPYNFETEDSNTWTGDIQPGNQISVILNTKITRCLSGTFVATGSYKDAEDNTVNIESVQKTINAEEWIILVDEEGWTDINVSPQTFEKVKSLVGAEDTIAALWLTATALDLGLDDPTIEKLLEHSSSLLDWLVEFIESGEVDASTLALLLDIVTSVGVNTVRIYMAANEIGKTTIYEDGTMDYHAVWTFEALESLIGPVIDAYIQTIEWGISKMNSGLLALTDTQGRLYLNINDTSGQEIPVYYGDNSAVAFLPLDIQGFNFSVNAMDAHESTEEYDLVYMRVKDGSATDGLILSKTINKGENQEFIIQIDADGKATIIVAGAFGDNTPLFILTGVAVASIVMALVIVVWRRRKKLE